jgi:hypothetical protein
MYWWRHFDAAEVAQDFARIRAAGFDTIRFFRRWEDFQPTPQRVAPVMLTHLVTVADIAAHKALALMPTLCTGHMSGVNWIPLTCAATAEPCPGYVDQRARAPGARASAESLPAVAGSPRADRPQDTP